MLRLVPIPRRVAGLLAGCLTLLPVPGQGVAVPGRILDINRTAAVDPAPAERRFVRMGDYLYYAGHQAASGVELFRTSLRTAAAALVRDIRPGPVGSQPFALTAIGSRVFFFAADGVHGFELWVTDGSATGTKMVRDFYPGLASAIVPDDGAPKPLGELLGSVLFCVDDGNDYALWRSDGTSSGTRKLRALGPWSPRTSIKAFVSAGFYGFFLVGDEVKGNRLWQTDGTTIGTKAVLDLPDNTDPGPPYRLSVVGWQVYVSSASNLWLLSGTTKPVRLVRSSGLLHAGFGALPNPARPRQMDFFFSAGTSLWRSDGTSRGTGLFYPRRGVGVVNSYLQSATVSNGRMFFYGFDLRRGEELWSTDGTMAGTGPVADVRPGPLGSTNRLGFGRERQLVSSGSLVFFAADDGRRGLELWVSDGTAAGTRPAGDINRGAKHSFPRRLLSLGSGAVAFVADDGAPGPSLWLYDATSRNLRRAAGNFVGYRPRTRESRVLGLQAHDDQVYFAADDGRFGSEPWCSDGTAAGTRLIKDLWAGRRSSLRHHDWRYGPSYGALAGVSRGRDLFFTGYRAERQLALFRTDGSAAGTVWLQDLDLNGSVGWPLHGRAVGTELFSYGYSKARGAGLYSFGRGASMTKLAGVWPGVHHRLGGRLIFTDGSTPMLRGVWASDGTVAGTVPLLRYRRPVFDPFHIVNRGRLALFATMNGGGELYQTDGTVRGTRRLRSAVIRSMTVVDDRVFTLEDAGTGVRLTVGDGTAAGTTTVHGTLPVSSHGLVAVGRQVMFISYAGLVPELWVSDATATGTSRIARLSDTGRVAPRIEGLRAIGSRRVFFRLLDARGLGGELWQSDGTAAGTVPLADVWKGPTAGVSTEFVQARGKLFFRGDDGRTGSVGGDLWAVELGAVSYPVGAGCGASGFAPRLRATDPVIGRTIDFSVRSTPMAAGLFLLGLPRLRPLELGFGCRIHGGTDVTLAITTSVQGRWQLSRVMVPNQPALRGVRFVTQVVIGPTAQPPLGLDVSNAVVSIVGN